MQLKLKELRLKEVLMENQEKVDPLAIRKFKRNLTILKFYLKLRWSSVGACSYLGHEEGTQEIYT